MRRTSLIVFSLLCTVLGSACQAPETPAPLATLRPSPVPTTAPTVTTVLPELPPTPEGLPTDSSAATAALMSDDLAVQLAIEALAAKLDVPASSIIQVDTPLPVQWNDSSLGCPVPGQVYTPVITPGYLVRLAFGDQTYNVHTDLVGTAIVCLEGDDDPVGQGTVPDPIVAEFIVQATQNLAEELGVAPESIVLTRSEAMEWSNSSLGCPEPGEEYLQVITPGYRIVLAVGEQRYEYHTDQQRMMLCLNPTE